MMSDPNLGVIFGQCFKPHIRIISTQTTLCIVISLWLQDTTLKTTT